MSDRRGKLIVLEGLDGSGKTTQITKIAEYLDSIGIKTWVTKEPQDNRPIGQLLRRFLSGDEKSDLRVAASLFAADRLDHIIRPGGILEMLKNGTYVLCDRYYLSNYAYNMVDVNIEWIIALNSEAAKLCKPDLHIYVDVPANIALSRITKRGENELFENLERLKIVHDNYEILLNRLSSVENIFRVDGTCNSSIVFSTIRDFIDRNILE